MDILFFIIGLITILLFISLDINNYKKDNYDPKIFRPNELANNAWLSFTACIICILPILFASASILKDAYTLVLISSLVLDKTILNLLLYKSKKLIFSMLETIIFDVILILFGIMILVKSIL